MVVMRVHLEKREPKQNISRYYRMSVLPNLFGEWTLQRNWGRIGQDGQVRLDLFFSQCEAEDALKELAYAKQNRDYEKV